MPAITQAYGNYGISPTQVSFSLLEMSLPPIFCDGVMVFALYFKVPIWSQSMQRELNHLDFGLVLGRAKV